MRRLPARTWTTIFASGLLALAAPAAAQAHRTGAHRPAGHAAQAQALASAGAQVHELAQAKRVATRAYRRAKLEIVTLREARKDVEGQLRSAARVQRRAARIAVRIQARRQRLSELQAAGAGTKAIERVEGEVAALEARGESVPSSAASPAAQTSALQATVAQQQSSEQELLAKLPALKQAAESAEASFRAAKSSLQQLRAAAAH